MSSPFDAADWPLRCGICAGGSLTMFQTVHAHPPQYRVLSLSPLTCDRCGAFYIGNRSDLPQIENEDGWVLRRVVSLKRRLGDPRLKRQVLGEPNDPPIELELLDHAGRRIGTRLG